MTHDFTRYTTHFAGGPLDCNKYHTHGLGSVHKLLAMCMRQNSERFLCRLFKASTRDIDPTVKDTDLIFYFDGSKVCLFFHPQDEGQYQTLNVFNQDEINLEASNLIGVIEYIWNLTYFLPESAFVTPKIALEAVSKHFRGEKLPLTEIRQEGDAITAVYDEMVVRGLFDDIL